MFRKIFDKVANQVSWLDASSFGMRDVKHVRGNWYKHPRSGEFCVPMMLGAPFCPDLNAFEAELVQIRTDDVHKPNYNPQKPFDHILASVPFVDAPIRKARGLKEAIKAIEHMNAELETHGYKRVSDQHVAFHMASLTNTSDPMYRVAMHDLGTEKIRTAHRSDGLEPSHIVARVVTQMRAPV